ncbi:MAG TPA: hypothetical protein VE871_19830 [Longimicrobium sp.]|nr:hypothetical protein [Longimicrobium sp.]
MPRTTLRILHAAASTLGLVTITTFFLSSLVAEIAGDRQAIVLVKTTIAYALFGLVPVMAIAGASGKRLAGPSRAPVIVRKMRRMKLVALNAAVVLIPCAITLYWMASHGRFGGEFAAVQGMELVAGAVNVVLLGLNLRDGLGMRSARCRGTRNAAARTRPDSLAKVR